MLQYCICIGITGTVTSKSQYQYKKTLPDFVD